jgi:hypothetical protein
MVQSQAVEQPTIGLGDDVTDLSPASMRTGGGRNLQLAEVLENVACIEG